MTPRARVLVLLGVAACLATCGEPTAPRHGGRAVLALQPVIPANINLAAFGLTIDSARVVVTGQTDTAYDETVFFPPDVAELRLDVSINLREERETVSVDLQLLSGRTPLFAGAQQVELRAGAPPAPVIIPLSYVGDNATTLTVSPADSVVTFGGAAQFRASATDAAGNPVTQFYVAWSTDSAGLTLNAAGVFRAPTRRTTTTVIARTPAGVTGSTPVTVVPPPATLFKVSGDGQADTVGNAVPQPFVVQVRAADGLGVRGVLVDFRALTGGGTVAAPRVVTDTGGYAQTTATLGPQPGTQTFQASVSGLPTTAIFAVNATAAVASRLTFTGQPSTAATGAPITPAVVVTALDRFGNVAAGYAGSVTIALGANPGGAILSGTPTVDAVSGVATFSDLRLDQAGAGYVLVASASGLTSASSVPFTVAAGAPVALAFAVQPSDAVAGSPISPPVTVEVRDAGGNRVTTATNPVTIDIGANPGGGVLMGTFTVAAASGVATFSDLRISAAGSGYTLVASATGLPPAPSNPFDVVLTAGGIAWTNPAGGFWSNPGNWSLGRVPINSDTVPITLDGTYAVTLDVDDTVAVLILGGATGTQTLLVSGRTFGVDSGGTIQTNGVLDLSSATLDGARTVVNSGTAVAFASTVNTAFANNGTLRVRASTFLNGALTTAMGSTLRVEGDALCCGAFVTVANGFTNNGTIELTAINGAGNTADLGVTNGTLVNAPGATIRALPGTGGTRQLDAQLDNRGTLTVNQAVTVGRGSSVHQNSGTIDLAGGDLTLSQFGTTPSFATTGTITVSAGDSLIVSGGTFGYAGGALGGPGTLAVNAATLALTPSFSNATLNLALSSSTVSGPGTLINAAGRTLTAFASTVNAPFDNQGLFVGRASTFLNGALTTGTGSTLRVEGDALCCGAFVTVANGFTNNGTIELTAVNGAGNAADLDVTNGTLVNAPGATIRALPGTGGTRQLDAQLDNRGTLTVNQALTIGRGSSVHQNSGTIDLAGGDLTLSQFGTTPSFTSTGTITVGGGDSLIVSGGTFAYAGGTIGGAGTLAFTFATVNLTPSLSNSVVALLVTGSTVNGPGTLINAAGRTLTVQSSTVAAPLANQGLLVLRASNTLSGPVSTAMGSTLRVEGDALCCGAFVTVANGFTNNGTFELTAVNGAGNAADLDVTNGTLVNAPGATIRVLAGTGGTRRLDAQLDNRGTLSVNQAVTVGRGSSVHQNSGTIDLAGGDLTLSQFGTTPSFTTTGTITLGAGDTLIVSGGTFAYAGGAIGGAGALAFSFATVNLTLSLSNSVVALSVSGSTVNGPGTLINAAGRTLTVQSSTVNAPLDNRGLLVLRATTNLNGALTTATGSTLRVEGDALCCGAFVTVANAFTNNGTIELTAINGAGNTADLTMPAGAGPLVNAAGAAIKVVSGTGGTRRLDAQLDNRGTLTVNQAVTVGRGSSVHQNSGTIDLAGGDLTLSQFGTTPSFTTTGTITVGAGDSLIVSGGTFAYAGGAIGGAGALAFSFATVNLTPSLSNAVVALSVTGSTVNGPGKLINAAGRTLTVQSSTVNAPLDNQGLVVLRATTNLNGPLTTAMGSTLRVEGDALCCGAFVTVANGFTNNGTLELTAVNGTTGSTADLNVTSGRLLNAVGAVIDVLAGTGGLRSLDVELDNQGTVAVDQAVTMGRANSVHGNGGTIKVTGGDLTVNQSGGNPSFMNNPGGVIDIGVLRTMKVSGFTVTNTGGGKILGSGTLDVATTTFTNLGDLNPGTSPGILTVAVGTGGMTHGSGGGVNIEIGGLTVGSQYDQLRVTGPGPVQLNGTLNVVLIGGFTATSGQTFTIMTYGSVTGAFVAPTLPPGFGSPNYGPTAVTVVCQAPTCP